VHRPLLGFDLRDIPTGATISAATLTLWYPATTATGAQVNLHRVTRAWNEGSAVYPGACTGSGASWNEAQGGVRWTGGGAIDTTADATLAAKARSTAGSDGFNVLSLVREWTSASAPNHGMVLKLASEAIPTAGAYYFDYYSDDHTTGSRPRLTVTFADGSIARGPRVAVSAPGNGETVRGGTVRLAAAAGDDRRVAKVEFLVDRLPVGTAATTAPYETEWNSTTVANGNHNVTARATDDAGNVTTSSAVTVKVDNTALPSVSVTDPSAGTTVDGTVTVSADASDDVSVSYVEFYMDGQRFGRDDTAPYSAPWNTLDDLLTAADGAHTLTARAYDSGGQEKISAGVGVTVDNTTGTQYQS
jgi:hypothetical protein